MFYFGHLIYADDTSYPSEVEIDTLHVERFRNRTDTG
jgi:hypothetical protein